MKDSREELFRDLERYIEENWVPSEEELRSENDLSEKKSREETDHESMIHEGVLHKDAFHEGTFEEEILPIGVHQKEVFQEEILHEKSFQGEASQEETLQEKSFQEEASQEGVLQEGVLHEVTLQKEKASRPKPSKKKEPESGRKGGIFDGSHSSAVSLDDLIEEVGQSFHEVLFEKVAASKMTDVEVYKRANMDRKLFSKIRNNPAYHPRKDTVLALAIALRLDIKETEDFLARAEYALSPGSKSDVIIRYFIERRIYDIDTINCALYDHELPVLQ